MTQNTTTSNTLGENDLNILEKIFDPEGMTSAPPQKKPELPEGPILNLDASLLQKIKALEVEGIKFAEEGSLDSAIEKFTEIIKLEPKYSSAYNNRAQAYRMSNKMENCLEDLDSAIKFGLETHDNNTLKQAYTQRGLIRKTRGEDELALQDFELGSKFGNALAKKIAVQENPYAKLCSAMVKEMMANAKQI